MLSANSNNNYILIQDQRSMTSEDDTMSLAATLIDSNNTMLYNCSSTSSVAPKRTNSVNSDRSSSIHSLYRRISSSIKRNFQESRQTRRENRREKRPQDGKTNPME